MKLDSLDKKPKVYNIAVLTGVMAAVLVLLLALGGQGQLRFSCLLFSVYFLAVTALLIRAFFLQMRYNLYSYNTIIYFGFALFTLFIAATYLQLFFRLDGVPEEAVPYNLMSSLLNTASTYAALTLPFVFVFSVALTVSNVSLIRHEGFRPVNALGILLAVLLLGGEAVIFQWSYYVSGSQTEVMIHDVVTNLLAAIYLYFECMMIGTIVADAIAARYEPEKDKDYIIVLGCAIRKDGTPTPLLRGRLDRALAFAREQEKATGKAPVFVLSGGQGADEVISEADSMANYLAEQGIGEDRMIREDQSTDTEENMRNAKALIFARDPGAKVAFSTTNYHVFRAGLKARRVKMRALGMGARTKWYFWPNAAVREFVGLLTQHRVKQGLILAGLVVSYVALTIIFYQMI